MLTENRVFDATTGPPERWDDAIFSCVSFSDLKIEGATADGALLYCALERVDWYWGLFNAAFVARTNFKNCVFRGCSFRSVDFVECAFEHCRFVQDNLGGACVFDDCRLVECVFNDCQIAPKTREGDEPVFTRSRFYGCAQFGGRCFERIAIT